MLQAFENKAAQSKDCGFRLVFVIRPDIAGASSHPAMCKDRCNAEKRDLVMTTLPEDSALRALLTCVRSIEEPDNAKECARS